MTWTSWSVNKQEEAGVDSAIELPVSPGLFFRRKD